MGALFGSTPKPPPIPVIPPAAHPATMANPQSAVAASNAKGKAADAATAGGTVGTTPEGLVAPPMTSQATLLGGTK